MAWPSFTAEPRTGGEVYHEWDDDANLNLADYYYYSDQGGIGTPKSDCPRRVCAPVLCFIVLTLNKVTELLDRREFSKGDGRGNERPTH